MRRGWGAGKNARAGSGEPDPALGGHGGAGIRTPVPWNFSVRFYVCSLSFSDGRGLAVPPVPFARAAPDKQGPARANRL